MHLNGWIVPICIAEIGRGEAASHNEYSNAIVQFRSSSQFELPDALLIVVAAPFKYFTIDR